MRPIHLLAALLALAFAAAGCVRFQEATLYSGVEPAPVPERPRSIQLAAEPIIFQEQTDDTVWFMEDERCTQGRVTDEVAHSGERSILVSWDRGTEGCEWAGFGVGWDAWAGKDLSSLLPYAAVQMQVRAREGTMYGLPVVLTLEDYTGGMGFAYTDNRYFERPVIDEEWQQVTVPLAAFDLAEENLDPTNVKQLMFELQQAGSIYVDDVELVFYEEPDREPWLTEEPRPDPTALPIQLFDESFINGNGWGLVTDACQSVEITDQDAVSGSQSLHLEWDLGPDRCYEAGMGVSWNRWFPVDMTAIDERAAIQLDVRLPSGSATELPVRIGLQDYSGQTASAQLDSRFSEQDRFGEQWLTVTVPVRDLEGEFDLSNVKQLVVTMDEAGELFIDDLRLVETY